MPLPSSSPPDALAASSTWTPDPEGGPKIYACGDWRIAVNDAAGPGYYFCWNAEADENEQFGGRIPLPFDAEDDLAWFGVLMREHGSPDYTGLPTAGLRPWLDAAQEPLVAQFEAEAERHAAEIAQLVASADIERFRLYTAEELGQFPPVRWHTGLEGYLPCGELIGFYGSGDSYKSFTALDWSCHLAKAGHTVVYIG